MRDIMSEDKIRKIDFDSAFPETPSVIHRAVLNAQVQIAKHERRKKLFRSSMTAAAACLLVVVGTVVFFMRGGGENSDYITSPVLTSVDVVIDMETPVFASRTDPYYHRAVECDLAYEDSVELPLVTAIEFEKTACPACAADLNIKGENMNTSGEEVKEDLQVPFRPVLTKSSGAAEAYSAIEKAEKKPVYKADFFGGKLEVYSDDDGSYIGVTDPSPDNEVFKYILIGTNQISAEEYYNANGGPGIYASYNPETKLLKAEWEDEYEYHMAYEWIIETETLDDTTGRFAWRMNSEQYKRFVKDSVLTADYRTDSFQPALAAALEQNK